MSSVDPTRTGFVLCVCQVPARRTHVPAGGDLRISTTSGRIHRSSTVTRAERPAEHVTDDHRRLLVVPEPDRPVGGRGGNTAGRIRTIAGCLGRVTK